MRRPTGPPCARPMAALKRYGGCSSLNEAYFQFSFTPLFDLVFMGRSLVFFFFFCLFRATAEARGGSQARGLIGAAAAGLRHSHSNAGSLTH